MSDPMRPGVQTPIKPGPVMPTVFTTNRREWMNTSNTGGGMFPSLSGGSPGAVSAFSRTTPQSRTAFPNYHPMQLTPASKLGRHPSPAQIGPGKVSGVGNPDRGEFASSPGNLYRAMQGLAAPPNRSSSIPNPRWGNQTGYGNMAGAQAYQSILRSQGR